MTQKHSNTTTQGQENEDQIAQIINLVELKTNRGPLISVSCYVNGKLPNHHSMNMLVSDVLEMFQSYATMTL